MIGTRIIAVSNQKGGTGKTTTVINLATSLSELGRRVLVVDLDPQANLTSGLGFHTSDDSVSSYDLVMNRVRADDVIQTGPNENMDVVRSGIELAGAETELIGEIGRERRLQHALSGIVRRNSGHEYKYIIIDTPPTLGILMVNALSTATDVIIPTPPAAFAISGLEQLINIIGTVQERVNPHLVGWRILMTMIDKRRNEDRTMKDGMRERFGSQVFDTEIRTNTRLIEAARLGIPVHHHDRSCVGSHDYADLAREIEGVDGGDQVRG